MNLLEGILLGAVQGVTEFLPISSSGHLVLAGDVLGVWSRAGDDALFLIVMTHTATMLAVLAYFRKPIRALLASLPALRHPGDASDQDRENLALAGYLLLASLPAGLAGLLLKVLLEERFEDLVRRPALVLAMLCATGAFLLATRWTSTSTARWTPLRALLVGVAQAIALLPGVSRSGATIGTGLFLKVKEEKAAEFSFLLAVPAIAGATVIEALTAPLPRDLLPASAAFVTAFLSGLLAIALLLGVLRKKSLWLFGFYCLAVGAGGLVLLAAQAGG